MTRPLAVDQRAQEARAKVLRAALVEDPKLALDACKAVREVFDASPEYALLTFLPWSDAAGKEGEPGGVTMRAPCKACRHASGVVRRVSGQDTVRCAACDAFAYNAPRSETGLPADLPAPREIESQYAGACRNCGRRHVEGDRVIWTRGTKGVLCLACGSDR